MLLNFSEIVHSVFWQEGEGGRDAIEIGSCVLKYLGEAYTNNFEIERSNRSHIYFLITSHTQNEGKHVHSDLLHQINSVRMRNSNSVRSKRIGFPGHSK